MPPYFFALVPAGWAYSAAMRLRAFLYSSGALRSRSLPCRVVSVGNLTAGGTGKTPMVAYVVKRLVGMGLSAAVVTRGYGGRREGETLVVSDGRETLLPAADSGDEPALLSRLLPGVPVVMGADRHAAGMLAVGRFSPDVVVLDDGFQHLALRRDADILLMDAAHPFGNGRVMPAGYLREPSCAAARADIIVLTRSGGLSPDGLSAAIERVSAASGGKPVITADHRPAGLRRVHSGEELGLEYIAGKRVFGFCGIAGPSSFALILKGLGAKITGLKGFSDHHAYTGQDLKAVTELACDTGAELIVTTGKDAVKLAGLQDTGMELLSLGIEIAVTDGAEALDGLLREKVLAV